MKTLTSLITRMYARYTPIGKLYLTIALTCIVVDMAIGYLAGASQATFWHGIGFAMLALGFAVLPDAAYEEYEKGRIYAALFVGVLSIPIGLKAGEQQITYSAGMRHSEIQTTSIVNAKYTGAQKNVSENETNFALWSKQLAELQAKAPWVATVKATALQDEIKVLDEKIASEIAGGRGGRAKGCKAECEKLKDQRTAVLAKIASVERMDDLTAKIEATKRVLDSGRKVANETEHRDSLNLSVAKFTAQMVGLFSGKSPQETIETDELSIRYATLGSASLGSLALLLMAPVSWFLANRRRKPEDESDESQDSHAAVSTHRQEAEDPIISMIRGRDGKIEISQTVTDERGVEDLKRRLARAMSRNGLQVA